MKWLLVLMVILLPVTVGCGLAIHFGGESFQNAVTGHMILGITTLVVGLVTAISLFVSQELG